MCVNCSNEDDRIGRVRLEQVQPLQKDQDERLVRVLGKGVKVGHYLGDNEVALSRSFEKEFELCESLDVVLIDLLV